MSDSADSRRVLGDHLPGLKVENKAAHLKRQLERHEAAEAPVQRARERRQRLERERGAQREDLQPRREGGEGRTQRAGVVEAADVLAHT